MRRKIYRIIDSVDKIDPISQVYDLFIVAVSILSILPLTVNENDYPAHIYSLSQTLDMGLVYILFFDYILCWATHDFRSKTTGLKAFILYPFTPRALVTLLALLPTLSPLPRLFALLRLVNLRRLTRYSKSLRLVSNAVAAERRTLVSTLILVLSYIFCAAIVVYVAEPGTFKNFYEALYWSTLANTSIGYADLYTQSVLGRFVSMLSALCSIAVVALPSAIITAGFMNQMREIDRIVEDAYFEGVISFSRMRELMHQAREAVKISMAKSGNTQLFPYIRWHFRNSPKSIVFPVAMLICLALNLSLYLLKPAIGLPFWLDMTGTAVAAMLLNPMAGLLVGFASNLIMATISGSSGSLLYFAESAITALVFGIFFGRGKKPGLKAFLALLAFAVVGEALFSLWMHFVYFGTHESTTLHSVLETELFAYGFTAFFANLFTEVVEKLIEITLTFILANTIFLLVLGSKYDPLRISERATSTAKAVDFPKMLEDIDSEKGRFNATAFAEGLEHGLPFRKEDSVSENPVDEDAENSTR